MYRIHLPMEPWMGEKIFVRVLDDRSDAGGHVSFDNFRFHATRPGRPTPPRTAPKLSIKMNWDVRYFAYSDHPLADKLNWEESHRRSSADYPAS